MTESAAAETMTIDLRTNGHVAQVMFERPGVLNALGPRDLLALADALERAAASDARVLVVRGGSGAFSAGDDLRQTATLDAAGWRDVVEAFHELTRIVRRAAAPVICVIDGVCIGGAFEFACSCDLRVATSRSRFGCPEVRVGITISNGSSLLLPQLCGTAFANELTLTGQLIGATEAARHGIVNAVVEPDELDAAVATLADQVAAQAPLAVQATKRLLTAANDEAVEAAMARETAAGAELFHTDDFGEGLAAFRDKRAPRFDGH